MTYAQRYLAEASWLPTALLPSEQLNWSVLDEHRALATLTDSRTTVSLEFSFNEVGEKYELTPWAAYHCHYQERGSMRIPLAGEIEWQLPDMCLSYCKLNVVKVEYEFAR